MAIKAGCGRCSSKVHDLASTQDAEGFTRKSGRLGNFATPAHKNPPSAASGMSSDYSDSPHRSRPTGMSRPTTTEDLSPRSRTTNRTRKRTGNMREIDQ